MAPLRIITTFVLLALTPVLARAQTAAPAPDAVPAPPPTAPLAQSSPPSESNQVLAPTSPPSHDSVTNKWWFWTAIGGVVAVTVTVLVLAGRQSTPQTTLGDMEAFGAKP